MKLFQPFVRQFEQALRHKNRCLSDPIPSSAGATPLAMKLGNRNHSSHKTPKLLQKLSRSSLLIAIMVITLTSALGYRFYQAPKLDINKAAPQAIYAPGTVVVEDQKATEEYRKAARTESISVLMLDRSANQRIQDLIQQQLQQGNEVREVSGKFPFTKTAALTLPTQSYLRKLPESDWQALLTTIDPSLAASVTIAKPDAVNSARSAPEAAQQKQAIQELKNYRRSVDLGAYLVLIQEITQARSQYASAINNLPQPISADLSPAIMQAIVDLPDQDWQKIRASLPKAGERILAQGIPQGLPQSILADAVKTHLRGTLSATAEPIASRLLITFLQPNLVRDEEQTRLRAEQAAQDIKPVVVTINRGETIVEAGETITSGKFALLDYFGLSRREIDWTGLISFGLLVSGAVAAIEFVKHRFRLTLRRRDGVLLWLLAISTPLLVVLHVPSTNLPAVGLLVSGFYGAPMGLTVIGLMTVLVAVGMDVSWSQLLASAAAGLLCGWLGARLRSREEIALLGVGVGILQGLFYLLLNVASGAVWYALLGDSAIQGLLGLAWVIVALGSSPYLEQLFDLVTTIRLVELANPNRPLLKRLCATTPGTFQHTLFVATLAEAAARTLGCNVELVRAGTLYHDIGKMHDPLGFIENQMGGVNKHDQINDPWVSAAIIKKHVSEGIVMARKARLPKAVQAFIPEHQGTMLIAYFYHQAHQQTEKSLDAQGMSRLVNEAEFRYDGPTPQSRETGIVMLADACEAALRSLKEATPEEALAMINKILRARWQDNQLINSGLTRDEMTQIAATFVQVWQQFNHQRIAYPKLPPSHKKSV
jgi:cyclic-di-AMP phosphodiesterase PgpH